MAHRTSRGTQFLMQAAVVSIAIDGALGQVDRPASSESVSPSIARAESSGASSTISLAQLPLEELQRRIADSSGKGRSGLLEQLGGDVRDLTLTKDQIDVLIEQLKVIQENDPYQEPRWGKVQRTPENARMIFVNRGRATRLIEELGYRKITIDLAALPLDQRISALMEYVEGKSPGKYESGWFSVELWRIGTDAVPPIMERMQATAEHDHIYVSLLSQIGDPRGVEAVVLALRRTPADGSSRLCDVIQSLRAYEWSYDKWKERTAQRDDMVDLLGIDWRQAAAASLIEVLRSEVRVISDARMRQQSRVGDETFPYRLYPVRQCAAEALSGITGEHWGMLFNEDHATWQGWSSAAAGQDFDPLDVPRTDQELAALIENFTYGCMRQNMRFYDWENRRLHEDSTLKTDIASLVRLGPRAVTMLVDTNQSITTEFPVWEEELKLWMIRLLEAMDTTEAREAAKRLSN